VFNSLAGFLEFLNAVTDDFLGWWEWLGLGFIAELRIRTS
jgi:hypothetical protein